MTDLCAVCRRPWNEHSYNTADICNGYIGPDRGLHKDQEDAIYAAYLGICVLQTMCRKVGLKLAVERASDLLNELGTAFPFIPERAALSVLRRDVGGPCK